MRKLDIKLQVSKQFVLLIISMLIGSLFIAATLPTSIWIRGLLAAVILAYGIIIFYSHGLLKAKKSIIHLSIRDNEWLIADHTRLYSVQLCGSSTVTTWVSVLRFKVTGERLKRSCVVFQDAIGQDQYRKMLVSARF